jgi:FMN phosphatase YigB (HAD superfamily)
MTLKHTPRPEWLTLDCYGTLIQWDEGLKTHHRAGGTRMSPARH